MSSKLSERIRELRLKKDWSQSELARKSGLSNEYISKIELGKAENVGLQTLEAISEALEINISLLITDGDGASVKSKKTLDKNLSIQLHEIPLLSGTVSASSFTHAFHDWEGETIGVPVKNVKNKVAWRIQGRSMEGPDGSGFRDGDVAVIDNSVQFSDGDMIVAENDHGVTIKELKLMKDGSVELRPLNPDFPTICLKSDKRLDVLGVVTHRIQDVRRKK